MNRDRLNKPGYRNVEMLKKNKTNKRNKVVHIVRRKNCQDVLYTDYTSGTNFLFNNQNSSDSQGSFPYLTKPYIFPM